jgi:DNA-binding transcriptional LysR family regulator
VSVDALSLRQLRFLVTLARVGNFSRAADEMAVTQPALSAAIRQVEEHVGARLFDRTTHHVALTEAGRTLLPHAQRLLVTADNAFADMRSAASHERATIRIGAMPSAIPAVAQAVVELVRRYPDVNFHLSDGTSDLLVDDLRKGAFDLIIGVSVGKGAGLETINLLEDDMVLVVPRDHRLAGQARISWSHLAKDEIVHFPGGSIGELCTAALRQNGLAASPRYRVNQVHSLYGLVLSGLALGIMPRLYTHAFDTTEVALVPLASPSVRRHVALLRRPELAQEHPVANRISPELAAAVKRLIAAESAAHG